MSELNQLTALLSFLAANSGVTLLDASRATGLPVPEIMRRLEAISLCGVPPYSPNDYISYRLIGAGADAIIDIQYAQHFARPLNFTTQETLALKYALDHFAAAADAESASLAGGLRDVLANALHGKAREALAENTRGFVVPRQAEAVRRLMSTLAEAVDGRWITELEYYSSHRARLGRRLVHPYQVIEIGPHFYLYGWCELAQATRHFRLDRIRAAQPTERRYDKPAPARRDAGRMAGIFEGAPRDTMTIRLAPEIARDVIDDWQGSPGAKITPRKGGGADLELPLFNQFWAVGFVTSLGKEARLLGPAWLKDEVTQAVRRTLAAH